MNYIEKVSFNPETELWAEWCVCSCCVPAKGRRRRRSERCEGGCVKQTPSLLTVTCFVDSSILSVSVSHSAARVCVGVTLMDGLHSGPVSPFVVCLVTSTQHFPAILLDPSSKPPTINKTGRSLCVLSDL